MISIKHVSRSYQLKDQSISILKDINLCIGSGLTYIVGKSGSGKSTLLNIIGGIDQPTSGNVYYDDTNVSDFTETQWSNFRKQKIGFIFQNFNLIKQLTAQENIEFSLRLAGVSSQKRKSRANELLKQVNMVGFAHQRIDKLSGGQKQRIAIARALANNPQTILADEPTGALDSQNAEAIMQLLKEISQADNRTVVVITHSTKFQNMADNIIKIKDGQTDCQQNQVFNEQRSIVAHQHGKKTHHYLAWSLLKVGLANIRRSKGRTFFSSLGASIGIFGILLISFLITGLNNQMNFIASSRVKQDTMLVSKKNGQLIGTQLAKNLKDKNIRAVFPTDRFSIQMHQGQHRVMDTAINIAPHKNELIKHYAQIGHAPLKGEEVAISKSILKKLALRPQQALGKTLTVNTQLLTGKAANIYPVQTSRVKIVGIYGSQAHHQGNVEMSYLTAQRLLQKSSVTKNKSVYYTIIPKSMNHLSQIKSKLNRLRLTTSDHSLGTVKRYLGIANGVIGALSSISLVVSTILICVVLYIGVTERTKEIGIMRAIGATPKYIQNMFVVEGGMIGIIGGLMGLVSAVGTSVLINTVIRSVSPAIKFNFFQYNVWEIGLLLGLSGLLGVLGAVLPARMASKKRPLEALRFD
ncbi:MAG: ATP-binding cassette domain-containing protein [Lentilactobacillus diolivorans]